MKKQDYDLRKKELLATYTSSMRALQSSFALENNPHKIGDIVKDFQGWMKIENVFPSLKFGNNYPECRYTGIELTLKMVPKLKQSGRGLFQSNVLEKKY